MPGPDRLTETHGKSREDRSRLKIEFIGCVANNDSAFPLIIGASIAGTDIHCLVVVFKYFRDIFSSAVVVVFETVISS